MEHVSPDLPMLNAWLSTPYTKRWAFQCSGAEMMYAVDLARGGRNAPAMDVGVCLLQCMPGQGAC